MSSVAPIRKIFNGQVDYDDFPYIICGSLDLGGYPAGYSGLDQWPAQKAAWLLGKPRLRGLQRGKGHLPVVRPARVQGRPSRSKSIGRVFYLFWHSSQRPNTTTRCVRSSKLCFRQAFSISPASGSAENSMNSPQPSQIICSWFGWLKVCS